MRAAVINRAELRTTLLAALASPHSKWCTWAVAVMSLHRSGPVRASAALMLTLCRRLSRTLHQSVNVVDEGEHTHALRG
jgi:hypothetical protein